MTAPVDKKINKKSTAKTANLKSSAAAFSAVKIATVKQMQAIEAEADQNGISYAQMMNTAGRAVADRVKDLIKEFPEPRVAVLVGPGNNGGDGLVAGRLIAAETNATVTFFLSRKRETSDKNSADENFAAVQAANLLIADAETDSKQGFRVLRTMIANADVIIDALLGTGSELPLKGNIEKIVQQVHQALNDRAADHPRPTIFSPKRPALSDYRKPIIVAVDIPTGLDADTGALDPNALYADETITFEAAKQGHLHQNAADAVGLLHIASLGLPERLPSCESITRALVTAAEVRARLPKRPDSANKGTFGKALIVAGSLNYIGAPALAAEAAYRVGAGLVTGAAPQPVVPILATHLLEATWVLLPHDMGVISRPAADVVLKEAQNYSAVLVGPGLGQEEATQEFIDAFLQKPSSKKSKPRIGFVVNPTDEPEPESISLPPLVIDADSLNLLAKMDAWWKKLPARTILTPHPGEMARLAKIEPDGERSAAEVVQADRLTLAAESAAKWNCIVVLKGAYTVIADPGGQVVVLPFANAGLARAGTGDVLAGAIVGYLAQGLDPFDAAVVGAYVHGYAGEIISDYLGTKASILASDVISVLADAISTIEQAE